MVLAGVHLVHRHQELLITYYKTLHVYTQNTTTGTLTRNADVAGFGAGIATNK